MTEPEHDAFRDSPDPEPASVDRLHGGMDPAVPRRDDAAASRWSPAAFSVGRPVTTVMLLLALCVLSAVAWKNIRMELIPSGFTPPFLFVQVPSMASAPEDVSDDLVLPIEDALATLRNLERLESQAGSNAATFLLQFRDGTQMDVAYNNVRDRVDDVLREQETELDQYFVWKYNPNDDPLAWLGVSVPEEYSRPELVVRRQLVPLLERIPGVSRVDVQGLPDEKVAVDVDAAAVRVIPGGLPVLVERIQQAQATTSAGIFESESGAMPLRIQAPLTTMDDLRTLAVAPGFELQDLAQISVVDEKEAFVYRMNQRPGIFISVYKESNANVVQTSRLVRAALEKAQVNDVALQGFEYHYFFDQGQLIQSSLGQLQSSAWVGGLLAVLCLFIFLRRVAITALVALCIPACLLLTVAALYATNRTLNVLSLTGMMLAVGMLVDNAIVVVEAIDLRLQQGVSRRRAALDGTQEVALPVVVSTLTTLIVFLPLTLMTGSETLSFYLSNIGFPVCVGLLASLFISLVVVPLASLWVFPEPNAAPAPTPELDAPARGATPNAEPELGWVTQKVRDLAELVLRRPEDAILLILLSLVTVSIPFSRVARMDGMNPNMNDVRISLDFDTSMTWDEKVAALEVYEQLLMDHKDALGLRDIRVGLGEIGIGDSELRAFLRDDAPLPREEVSSRLRALLPVLPGVEPELVEGGPQPTSGDARPTIALVGPDTATLIALSNDVRAKLREIPGVEAVSTSLEAPQDRVRSYRVDSERAAAAGVSPILVMTAMDFAIRGREVGQLGALSEARPILVRQEAVESVDDVDALEISPGSGVTVASITTVSESPSTPTIRRVQRETQVELTIDTQRQDIDALLREVDAALADIVFPRGYELRQGGAFEMVANAAKDQLFAVGLAVIFVFLLVGILFESFILPFAVLWSIPFAFVGVFWFLFLTGTAFDVMAAVGLLVLVGVVVNTAIVLVDYTRLREAQGVATEQALLDAITRRLRPIAMTALTTIVGLVPMAMGNATLVGIPYAPLGRAVIGGMLASTVLSLFVVPLFYLLLQRARFFVQRRLSAPERVAPRYIA